jgi:hypothetical protein
MDADYGGTEILQPLDDIYGRPLIDGYPRQVSMSVIINNNLKVPAKIK